MTTSHSPHHTTPLFTPHEETLSVVHFCVSFLSWGTHGQEFMWWYSDSICRCLGWSIFALSISLPCHYNVFVPWIVSWDVKKSEEEWRRVRKSMEEYGGVSWQCVPCRHYVFMGTRAAAWILYGWQNGSNHHFISRGRSYSVNYVWKLYWNAPSVCSWLVLAVLLLWFLFIRYQISSLCCRTNVGANEPLELASAVESCNWRQRGSRRNVSRCDPGPSTPRHSCRTTNK